MIITSKQYPSRELLESDILQYKTDLIAHAQTVGVPAPWPPNDLVENIVKNNLDWTWEEVVDAQIPDLTPEPLQGYDFVSDMYNDFLSKKFYYDGLSDYQKSRSTEYPPVGDQLDALFKAGLFPEEMTAQIQAVKDKYPKPEQV